MLQKELRECLETSSEKYDRVVDHYDNVLRERAADLEDLQAQVFWGDLVYHVTCCVSRDVFLIVRQNIIFIS